MFGRKKENNSLTQVPTPTTAALWYGNQDNVKGLRDVVTQPLFRLAEATLKDGARPTRTNLSSAEDNSLNLAWYAGYCDAFRDIQNLTHTPKKFLQPDLEEWAHVE